MLWPFEHVKPNPFIVPYSIKKNAGLREALEVGLKVHDEQQEIVLK